MAGRGIPTDSEFLRCFGRLAESDESGTVETTKLLLKKLESSQNGHESASKDLAYSLTRLVKGVSSNRKTARQGFSVALCQVLRKFTMISTQDVLTSANEHLQVSKKDSKSDVGGVLLGKTLVYLALVQSGRLAQDSADCIKSVVGYLLHLRTRRSYLQQICGNAVVQLIRQVDEDKFLSGVLPCVEKQLMIGWDRCTPDSLLLLLVVCHSKHQAHFGKLFLKEHWGYKKIIREKNFDRIWRVVLKTAETYPVIHSVTIEVIQEVARSKVSLGDFWSHGVDLLFCTNHTRSTNLGLHILNHILPRVTSPDEAESVLCPTVLTVLLRHVDKKINRNNPIHAMAVQTTENLIKYLQTCGDGGIQHAVLTKVFDLKGYRPSPDIARVVERITLNLTAEGAKLYGKFLLEYFCNEKRGNQLSRETVSRLRDVVSEVRTLVTLQSTCTDHDWQLYLLQFLALHSFCVVSKPSQILHCSTTNWRIDDVMQNKFQNNFLKALNNLLVFKTEKTKSASVMAYIDICYSLVQYMQTLMVGGDSVTLVMEQHGEIPEEWRADWNTAVNMCETVKTKHIVTSDKTTAGHAFMLLLLYNTLQLMVDPDNASSHLQDIYGCLENAFKSKPKSKAPANQPAWIEVMTELLISMMSQGSVLARTTATDVYMALTDHHTPASVQLIVDVLMSDKDGKEGPVSFEEAEEMEEEDVPENGHITKEEEASDETDESESEEEEMNENFRQTVKSALGPAADDESGSEDLEDLSDSEMFKLDEVIAAAFRGMSRAKDKDKEKNKKQMLAFKIRLLDMLNVLAKGRISADIVMELNLPLLELILNGEKKKDERELGAHAQKLSSIMFKRAKELDCCNLDLERCKERIMEIIYFSTRPMLSKSLIKTMSDACLLMILLCLNVDPDKVTPSPVKTRSGKASRKREADSTQEYRHQHVMDIITKNLDSYVHGRTIKDKSGRNVQLNPALFLNMFARYPVLFWDVTTLLLNVHDNDSVRVYNKTQASAMLAVMLNKNVVERIGDLWTEFAPLAFQTLSQVVCDTQKEKYFPKYMYNVLDILAKITSLATPAQDCVVSEEVRAKMIELHKCFNKDHRQIVRILLRKTDPSTESTASGEKKNKKSKKRKRKEDETEEDGKQPEKKSLKQTYKL